MCRASSLACSSTGRSYPARSRNWFSVQRGPSLVDPLHPPRAAWETIGVPTLEAEIVETIDADATPALHAVAVRNALVLRHRNPRFVYKNVRVPRELAIRLYVWPEDGPPRGLYEPD
jgi:hypothetical protein